MHYTYLKSSLGKLNTPVFVSGGAIIDDVLGWELVSRRPPLVVLVSMATRQ